MNNHLESLGLPEDKVSNMATAYRGYALALEKEEPGKVDQNGPWIASSYLISASFFLLTDPAAAKEMFFRAALIYQRLGVSFWTVCAICADNFEGILNNKERLNNEDFVNNPRDGFYNILTTFYNSTSYFEPYWPNPFYKGKLPRIDIPYRLVFEVMVESNNWKERYIDGSRDLSKFSELLRRAFEPTALSKADHFHWSKVQGTILPFDPQGLALVVTFTKKWRQEHNFNELLELIEADNEQKTLLRIANEIVSGEDRRFLKE